MSENEKGKYVFETERQNFVKVLTQVLTSDDALRCIDALRDASRKSPGSDGDRRLSMDQAFKDMILKAVVDNYTIENMQKIVSLSIEACEIDICTSTLPIILLCDVIDCVTIDKCEALFYFIESHVNTWKKEIFFNHSKNSLLRICNELLRRLSRSQNTVFCGRILLFLAKYFPLSERSGLNVASEFNMDNKTIFGDQSDLGDFPGDKEEPMDEGDEPKEVTNTLKVDFNLYWKFWSLQDFFRDPNQFYSKKTTWTPFTSYTEEVLKAFNSFKLDDNKSKSRHLQPQPESLDEKSSMYFAKYLTNPKLLDLQLSDSNFRRCVLIQFLILFQYFNSSVRFKLDTFVFTEEQLQWIKVTTAGVYKLLEETPPDGAKFAKTIEHILKREEHWSHWKNEGCKEFCQPPAEMADEIFQRPKRRAGDDMRIATDRKKILLGNASLTKLWNLCPNNMEACRLPKRDFLPSLEKYFEEAIEQADPANMIEDEYKHIFNGNYGWRALRLLARRSPHFFTPSTQPISRLPAYLETMIKKIAKEIPVTANEEEMKMAESHEKVVVADGADDSEDEMLKNSEEAPKDEAVNPKDDEIPAAKILPDQILTIAKRLGENWKRLALWLGCEEDEIDYYQSQFAGNVEQAQQMLKVWMDNFPDKANPKTLREALVHIGLEEAVKDVFSDDE